MVGHPDWQTYSQWRDNPTINETTVFPTGDTAYAIQTTPHFASLFIHAHLNSGQASVKVVHIGSGPSEATSISHLWPITTTTGLIATIPLMSVSWRVHIVVPVGQTANLDLTVEPTNVGPQGIDYPVAGNFITKLHTTLAALATDLWPLTHVQGGPASIFFSPDDTLQKINAEVAVQNPDGTNGNNVWEVVQPVGSTREVLYLPDAPVIIRVHNVDNAASHNYSLGFVPGGPT